MYYSCMLKEDQLVWLTLAKQIIAKGNPFVGIKGFFAYV